VLGGRCDTTHPCWPSSSGIPRRAAVRYRPQFWHKSRPAGTRYSSGWAQWRQMFCTDI